MPHVVSAPVAAGVEVNTLNVHYDPGRRAVRSENTRSHMLRLVHTHTHVGGTTERVSVLWLLVVVVADVVVGN